MREQLVEADLCFLRRRGSRRLREKRTSSSRESVFSSVLEWTLQSWLAGA